MNNHRSHRRIAVFVILVVTIPVLLASALVGQISVVHAVPAAGTPPIYKLIDLGTFGGKDANTTTLSLDVQRGWLSTSGAVVGEVGTAKSDPYGPNYCWDGSCQTVHAFEWNGKLHDLGTLPGGSNSQAMWVSPTGHWVAGVSQTGKSVLYLKWPSIGNSAVVWKDGKMTNLGTFGGSFGFSNSVNDRGQVAGVAWNKTPDPVSDWCACYLGTQTRAFMWRPGMKNKKDLGTLGGPDALASIINNNGQIAGQSFTDSKVHKNTGTPTQVPFIWQKGKMTPLGSLGGTVGYPTDMNDRGAIVGSSNLKGDAVAHAFIWKKGKLIGLATLGGGTGYPNMINNSGEIVGLANNKVPCVNCSFPALGLNFASTSQQYHAVLWRNGRTIDLGSPAGQPCSSATAINSSGSVVGRSGPCIGFSDQETPLLWVHGRMMNLNTLAAAAAHSVKLLEPYSINQKGEIVVGGIVPQGRPGCSAAVGHRCFHSFLLRPIR